jgi:hypothetical protein
VDSELGRISADTVDVRKELGELEKDSEIKPPSFKDVSNKQLLIATTAGGALLGGVGGVINALGAGPAQVSFNEQVHPIMEPKLNGTGFQIRTYTVGGTESNPGGWDVDITRSPLTEQKVGEYTTREPVGSSTTSVLLSGAIGVGVGAAAGAGIGLLGIGLRKVLKQEYSGAAPRQTEGDNKVLITAGVAGAVIGAAAGGLSSLIQSHTVSYETQSVQTENKVIGHIPHGANVDKGGFYVPNSHGNHVPANAEEVQRWMNGNFNSHERNGFTNLNELRPDEVRADVPKRGLLGGLKIDSESKTTSVGPGLLTSVAGGAVIGGVTGVAGGVLLNVLRKTL